MEELVPFKPIPILKFPELVNRHILLTTTPSQIFLMSLCSQKTKEMLNKSMFKVDEIWIDLKKSCGSPRITFLIRVNGKEFNVLYLEECQNQQVEHLLAEFGVFSEYKFIEDTVVFSSNLGVRIDPVNKLHKYVCDLFHCDSSQIYVKTDFFKKLCMFNDESVGRCILSRVTNHQMHCDLERFFQRHSNQLISIIEFLPLRVAIDFRVRTHHLSIIKSSSVILRNFNDSAYYMWQFEGQHLLCENARINSDSINEILLKWGTNCMNNLKSIIIYHLAEFDCSTILNYVTSNKTATELAIKVEEWDAAKRASVYPYQSIISHYHTFSPDTFDCSNGMDIVRNSDSKRATIKLSPQHFMFFVWP